MKYQTILQTHGIKEEELSSSLKNKLEKLKKIGAARDFAETEMKKPNISAEMKADYKEKFAEAKEAYADADKVLTEAIEKWIPNREKYAASFNRMKEGKDNKAASKGNAPAAPAVTKPATQQAAAAPAQAQKPATTTPAPAKPAAPAEPVKKPVEEKTNLWKPVLIVGAILLAAFTGVKIYQANK